MADDLSAGSVPLFGSRRGAVPVAEDTGNPPGAILLRPDHHELGNPFAAPRREVAEAVLAFLDRAIVLDRIDAERRPYELWAALDNMLRRGPKWRRLSMLSVEERPTIADRLQAIEEEFGPAGGET